MTANAMLRQLDPRIEFWSKPNAWPINTSDYIFAGHAVLQVGKSRFPDDWNEKDPAFRWEQELPEVLTIYTPIEEIWRASRELYRVSAEYRSRAVGGLVNAGEDFPTRDEWQLARSIVNERVSSAREGFTRYFKAIAEITDAARSGAIKTGLRAFHGGMPDWKGPEFWYCEEFWRRFTTCRVKTENIFVAEEKPDQGLWLCFERYSFAEWLTGAPKPSQIPDEQVQEFEQAVVEKRRPGRPPKYDWEDLASEIIRRAAEGELPSSERELIRELLEWCSLEWGCEPSESRIREVVNKLLGRIPRD